ncbi:uncharacterized protein LOC119698248 [Motacilla alba alba]|uniref:uncharacterized protein LOC119698248 n=1 Tax=Motacilla alba alba TaxID=1094192 RepID=UPI0018D56D23|nr:uncharacterized protein LOC119698248 [Motacilla alba alba]
MSGWFKAAPGKIRAMWQTYTAALLIFALLMDSPDIAGGVGTHQAWAPPQPKTDIWVTMANLTNQEAICLSLSSPGNPFTTCLVGVPADPWPCPSRIATCRTSDARFSIDNWDQWISHFPTAPQEPQELELLGSVMADACLKFSHKSQLPAKNHSTIVTSSMAVYRNATAWCNYTTNKASISSNDPIQLPAGYFLICRDRAWPGVPSVLSGGPCTIGRLSLLTPNTSMILNMSRHHHRNKRMAHAFTADCKDDVKFWSPGSIVAASFLTPGVSAAGAHAILNKFECWLAKQTNATSLSLSSLLLDVDSIRHATLQNRAAIDFLLLAQGRGCEAFEGMCCMNLSDHSQSIHSQLSELRRLTGNLQVESGFGIDGWLKSLGLGSWLRSIVKVSIIVGIIALLVVLILPCFCICLQNMISAAFNQSMIVQQKNGGRGEDFVNSRLAEKGHGGIIPLVKQEGDKHGN